MSAAAPTGYPGNPSLPREVRDKILSTFRHTLNLFKEGKSDDCVIGCDFILKMDPRFAPARQLMEKAKNPAAAVDVADLESIVAATPTRQERVASVESDKLLVRAAESLNARDFDGAIATAGQVLAALPGNRDAQAILEKARQRKESGPLIEVARQRAMMALDAKKPAEARAAIDRMRSIDPDHPSIADIERRIAEAKAAKELGESTNPGLGGPLAESPASPAAGSGGLGELSLDSLSLDESFDSSSAVTPPDLGFGAPSGGPLSLDDFQTSEPAFGSSEPSFPSGEAAAPAAAPGGPQDMWGPDPAEAPVAQGADGYPAAFSMGEAEPEPEPEAPSPRQEIEGLLARGDEAARAGSRQQAIEIWSRIFLIDINNADAVGRIETVRQEMAEGNKRVAESLRAGREKFEAGDFTAAREAFLQVLAFDETDATARSYIDRIEQELARPSAGLDLSRKAPASDILAEEMADASQPDLDIRPELSAADIMEEEAVAEKAPRAEGPRRGFDKRFVIALGGALVLAIGVGAYFLLRGGGAPAPAVSADGASLQRATDLFRDGKIPETIAELKRIGPQHPDYARAQKLLTSLTKKAEGGDAAAASGSSPDAAPAGAPADAASGPPAAAVSQREVAEKALSEKRYIDALKNFSLAQSAFQNDPTFSQQMGEASEKVAELTPAVKLYNEGEYDTAIPILWRIFQSDRSNQDARSYLVRSYYNQGIAQLQNGLYPKAVESFNEVLGVDPDDAEAARNKKFAERYLKGDLDLMGRIYVRHVQQRP